jgi:hypothetical protein
MAINRPALELKFNSNINTRGGGRGVEEEKKRRKKYGNFS